MANLKRLFQVMWVVLTEAGFGAIKRRPLPERIYRTIVKLGPTFIKLGQVASTRPDLVPSEIAERLRDLQESVPSFPSSQVKEVVEQELGRPIAEAFRKFDMSPKAAASLAQVHFAQLPGGETVAVKVQRPGIAKLMKQDLALLGTVASLIERFSKVARRLQMRAIVDEFSAWTLRELDFRLEGRNADEFRANFSAWDDVAFPVIFWEYSTERVLTMEKMSGCRVWDMKEEAASFRWKLAKRLANLQMKMFINDAFFHADMHPGNVFFRNDGSIAILDMGMVGRLTATQRDRFLAYWTAVARGQRQRAFNHLLKMALSTKGADLVGFRSNYDNILDEFYVAKLEDRSLASVYLEIVLSGANYGVTFPSEMILQAKAVVTAESLTLELAPDFRFSREVTPILARELAERAGPRALIERFWRDLPDLLLLGETFLDDEDDTALGHGKGEEREYRKQAKQALVGAWSDDLDSRLRDLTDEIPRYTTARFWQEHPEWHVLLQTGLTLLYLAAQGKKRVEEKSATIEGSTDIAQLLSYLLNTVARFDEEGFWDERYEVEAAVNALLSTARVLLGQAGSAITS